MSAVLEVWAKLKTQLEETAKHGGGSIKFLKNFALVFQYHLKFSSSNSVLYTVDVIFIIYKELKSKYNYEYVWSNKQFDFEHKYTYSTALHIEVYL